MQPSLARGHYMLVRKQAQKGTGRLLNILDSLLCLSGSGFCHPFPEGACDGPFWIEVFVITRVTVILHSCFCSLCP